MCLYTYVYTCMKSRYIYVYRYVYPFMEEIRLDIFGSPDSAVFIYIYIYRYNCMYAWDAKVM